MSKHVLAFTLLLIASTSAQAEARRYTLDPEHTTLAFLVEHVGYARTLGYFSEVSGSFMYDADSREVSDVSITVETDSVQTDNKARDRHLRSKDFLDTGNHAQMIFTADATTIDAAGEGNLTGQLQLLGETRPLSLSVVLNKADDYPFGHKKFTLGVSARGSLQRSDYGMAYGVANQLVGDTVDLIIEIEANRD